MALASAPPMYSDAANRSLLQHELQTVPNRSAFSFFYHYVKGSSVEGADWQDYFALNQYMETRYTQDLGLPYRSDMHYVKSDLLQVFPARDGSTNCGTSLFCVATWALSTEWRSTFRLLRAGFRRRTAVSGTTAT